MMKQCQKPKSFGKAEKLFNRLKDQALRSLTVYSQISGARCVTFKKVTKTFSIRKTRQIPPSVISLAKTGRY